MRMASRGFDEDWGRTKMVCVGVGGGKVGWGEVGEEGMGGRMGGRTVSILVRDVQRR